MAFAMSATSASLSFGRNVASTQGLRVTAVRARAFLASRLRTAIRAIPRSASHLSTFPASTSRDARRERHLTSDSLLV
eukprot:30893-Pelagococcus_subviridis.AAC.10